MIKKTLRSFNRNLFSRGLFLILAALSIAGLLCDAGQAQSSGGVEISSIELGGFPSLSFLLKASDGEGKLISDLQIDQLQLLEDGNVRSISALERIQPGMQIILAINESPTLTNQLEGLSYYRLLMQALENWVQALPVDTPDNFSYVTNNIAQIVQADDPRVFTQALIGYEPNLLAARPGITSLSQALDMTTDALPSPYMKRAILYVTPLPDAAAREALPSLAERAAQLGTYVFVWLIAPGFPLESPEIAPLRQLADLSGGEIFLYTGAEDFPNPESYFEALRYIYQITYDSGIQVSGEHRLVASVLRSDLQATSNELSFSMDVLPPNPIFLKPPAQIVRAAPEGEENALLQPESVPIRILLEFPDAHPRPLRYSRLYVNDEIVAENVSAPFDQFSLSLAEFTQSGPLRLKVEVEDTLGLSQSSIETLVELVVIIPETNWVKTFFTGRGLSIVIALSVAAIVLVVVIVFTSQGNLVARINSRRARQNRDVVTQPVMMRDERKKAMPAAGNSPTTRRVQDLGSAPAQLVRISDDGKPMQQRAIPLIRSEITLGSDPQQAICVLDAPSVDPLHARLYQDEAGDFYLADAGSIAGTWINYEPVTEEGKRLENADVIHLGLLAFRLELKNPTRVWKPRVTPYRADEL